MIGEKIPASGQAETLRQCLRQAVHEGHARLDSHPALAVLTDAIFDLRRYRRTLQLLHVILAPVEARLADYAARGDGPALPAFSRMAALAGDIAFFGDVLPESAWQGPEIDSPAEAAGILYVLAGATRGGARIADLLRERAGLTADNGARFFADAAASGLWDGFMAYAADAVGESDVAVTRRAAARLFDDLHAVLAHADTVEAIG